MLASLFLLQSLLSAFARKVNLPLSQILHLSHLSLFCSYISLLRAGHIASPLYLLVRVLSSPVADLITRQGTRFQSRLQYLNGSILAWYIVLQSPLHAVP